MQNINQVLLTSAKSKISHSSDLEQLAEDHKNYILYNVSSLYEPPTLTAGELLALYQSAQNDAEDAKALASFLHQIDKVYIKKLLDESQGTIPAKDYSNLTAILLNKDMHCRTALEMVLQSEQENNQNMRNHTIYLLGLLETKQNRPQGWGKGNLTGIMRLNQLIDDPEYGLALQKEFPQKFTPVEQPVKEAPTAAWQSSIPPQTTASRKKSETKIPEIEKTIVDKIRTIMEKESKMGIKPDVFKDIDKELHKYNLGDRSVYPTILSELKKLLAHKTQSKQDSLTKKALKTLGEISDTFQKADHSHVVSFVIYEALKQQDNQKVLSYLTQYESNRKVHPEIVPKIPSKLLEKHTQQVEKSGEYAPKK